MYDIQYILFLAHFNASRDYFECHEILEEYWKNQRNGAKNSLEVALIQLAVGQYHYRNSNPLGAKKMLLSAKNIFELNKKSFQSSGIDYLALMSDIEATLSNLSKNKQFRDFNIKFNDKILESKVKEVCANNGWRYLGPSNLDDVEIVKKHIRRGK